MELRSVKLFSVRPQTFLYISKLIRLRIFNDPIAASQISAMMHPLLPTQADFSWPQTEVEIPTSDAEKHQSPSFLNQLPPLMSDQNRADGFGD
jgi:hypothetical protein